MKYRHPYNATHYVSPRRGMSAGVKEADFFIDQGGHRERWGATWIPIVAEGINHAHLLGRLMAEDLCRQVYDCSFSWPNTRTVQQIRQDKDGFPDWPAWPKDAIPPS